MLKIIASPFSTISCIYLYDEAIGVLVEQVVTFKPTLYYINVSS